MLKTVSAALMVLALAVTALGASSVSVDPSLAYYSGRSAASIADELIANGYTDVHLVCSSESGTDADFVKALADAGLKVWMQVSLNTVASSTKLPDGSKSWGMKLKKNDAGASSTYFCLNNPGYREWRKAEIVKALSSMRFYGVDLTDCFFPGTSGPDDDSYGCICDACVQAFHKMYPDAKNLPDFTNGASPNYYKRNTRLYEEWIGFRVSSVVGFLDDLVNGTGGIREKCQLVKVATWSPASGAASAIKTLREHNGVEAAAIVNRVKPDIHVLSTDISEWSQPDISDSYPEKYKPITDSLHEAAPLLTIALQTDIGSHKDTRRSREWMKQVEKSASTIRCDTVIFSDYSMGDYIYTEQPVVVKAVSETGGVKLIFNKCLDAISASSIANYTLSSGRVDFAKVDGNVVHLTVSGVTDGIVIVIANLADDTSRRLFSDKSSCGMERSVEVTVEKAPVSDNS